MSRRRKMLFKIGLTLIVGIAVYLYFSLENSRLRVKINGSNHLEPSSVDSVDKSIKSQLHTNEQHAGGEKVDEEHKFSLEERKANGDPAGKVKRSVLHLAVVACGDRFQEIAVMLKSAVLFSRSFIVFHIFAEENLHLQFKEQLEFWPEAVREQIRYYIYNISFPTYEELGASEWKKLFKPCASQRLFIPSLLTDIDSLLYVDTDVLFLSPLDEIWSFFSKFNSTQMAAVAPEHEDYAIGWYNRFARHPFYGELGVNSGVMLMNLTRIRASAWLPSLINLYKEYRLKLTFGDQDLINIYFHFHPDQLYLLSCEWNYRPDHCMYMSVCKPAEVTGAYILHGCRRTWHEDKQPVFKAIYTAFKQHSLGVDIRYGLMESVYQHLNGAKKSNCGNHREIFVKQLHRYTNTSYPVL